MTRLSFFLILFIPGASNFLFGQQVTNATDLGRLRKFRADYSQSLMDKKVGDLTPYLSENVRLMPETQKTIIGKKHVLTYWTEFSTRFDIETSTLTETENLDLGGQLFETGSLSLKMKLKDTGKAYELKGKYVLLWERVDNKLQLLTFAWNYDHGIDFHNDLKFINVPVVNVAMASHVPVKDPISFELAALNRLMEATIMERDAVIWKQFYSDDGAFLYSNHVAVQGRNAIDEFLDQHVKEVPIFEKLDVRNDRIDDLGKYVIEYASHIAIVRNGEWSGVFTGKDLVIWRREFNGSLKIFRHIAMYDSD